MSDVFAITYGVQLLCPSAPDIAKPALFESLSRFCPGVQPLDGDPGSTLLSFVHPSYLIQMADVQLPAQTLIASSEEPVRLEELEAALQQAWEFPGARQAAAQCQASIIVTDLMTSGLEYRERVDLFQRALRGVLACVDCRAIRWTASNRIVDPRDWLERFDAGDAGQLFMGGAMNVRLFNVTREDGTEGELVMDTLGLGALGLPDLQCHFSQLEPGAVARVLFNTAWYIFGEGDVIEDGHTVQGIEDGSRWRCQHEDSLIAPDRVVLDLNPGAAYAAGNRH